MTTPWPPLFRAMAVAAMADHSTQRVAIDPNTGPLPTGSATLADLHFGMLVARDPQLSVRQRKFDAVPIDNAVAASYGQLDASAGRLVVMALTPTAV